MKTAILGTIALAALSFGRFATASTIQYLYNSFAEVGTEVAYVEPWEINESGQVTGRAQVDSGVVPFVTGPNGANLRLISLAPPDDLGNAFGINDLGQVSGSSATGRTVARPFFTAPNDDVAQYFRFHGYASDINNRGQVVGTAIRGPHDPPNAPAGLFLANASDGSFKIVDPTVFSYEPWTTLNDLGQIAGELQVPNRGGTTHVFVTDPEGGALHDISGPRDFSALATDINNSGDVVGSFVPGHGDRDPFVSYNGARRIDIGVLAGGGSEAEGINDAGTVVGYSGPEAFIYTPETGIQDLNSFIDPSLGIHIIEAFDINNAGEILARTSDGVVVILFPRNINGVPDVGSTAILFVCALASLTVLRRCLAV